MKQLKNKTYIKTIDLKAGNGIELDRGYGIESEAYSIDLEFDCGLNLVSATAYGMHFITEREIDWELNLSQDEALELLAENGL